ncbi:MAG TPA: hypothetical protein IGS52_21990 [Oscillatoriaceae cyanobacterium M33_DOE_052]|uniref:Uncharacterized protein n=1 Tax=Planktothricoides sp. SpSt-374 TaxID=2282167 RepID=A0A7C3VG40_9CYAN|nr:hypothetical protein [Oscillatoriaceae cyanobacterium M33_DOE_052]
MDAIQKLAIENIKNLSVEEFLSLLRQKETLVVQFSPGEVLTIRATVELAPLPKLDGYIPQGWKDAIYHE